MIKSILVKTSPSVAWLIGNPTPQNLAQARFSVQFALALILSDLDPGEVPLPEKWLEDRQVKKWSSRICIEGREDIGRRKAYVEIVFDDGNTIHAAQPLKPH